MADNESQDLSLRALVHDLNDVFQTIQDAADLLAKDPKWKKAAGAILRSSERGQRLVGSLLEASSSAFEFATVAETSVQFAQDYLHASQGPPIDFRVEIPAGLRLRGNTAAWERILVNLLLNAAQAMRQGGRVDLVAGRTGDGVTVRVSDNGPGIAPSILPKVFEPHVSTKRTGSGLLHGLGLHIVRTMVHLNGGTVSVHNREEGGAEFVILCGDDQS